MMTTKKKALSLFLALIIGFQSTVFAANSVIENALYNYTPASSAKAADSNGNTIKTMYQTGSFYFRFNESATPEPLWNFSPPSIEAGCNGLNIKGMFVSLLGLDQFGAMLQNAGTTLAWGVAVGLIYSLPGVASVFKMINTWAKQIQNLLSQACNSGIAIGQALGNEIGKGYKGSEIENTITGILPSSDTMTTLQNGLSGLTTTMGLDGLEASWDKGFTFSAPKTLTDQGKQDVLVGPLQQLFGDTSVGGSIYMDYLLNGPANDSLEDIKDHISSASGPNVFTRRMILTMNGTEVPSGFSGDNYYEDVEHIKDGYYTEEEKDAAGLLFFGYAIYYNMVGDMGFKDGVADNLEKLAEIFACSDIVSSPPSTPAPGQSPKPGSTKPKVTVPTSKAACQKLLADGIFKPKHPMSPEPVGVKRTETGGAEWLKTFIINGVEGITKSGDKNGKLIAPEFFIIATKEKNVTTKSFTIVPTNPTVKSSFFDDNLSYGGAKAVSQCSLYKELSGTIPENYIYQLKTDDKGNSLDCDSFPKLIFGDMKIYADILYKAKDSEIIEGVNRMVLTNEYYLVESILGTMASMLHTTKSSQPKISTNENLEKAKASYLAEANVFNLGQAQMSKFSKVLAQTKVALDSKYSNVAKDRNMLSVYFRSLETKIAERSLQRQK